MALSLEQLRELEQNASNLRELRNAVEPFEAGRKKQPYYPLYMELKGSYSSSRLSVSEKNFNKIKKYAIKVLNEEIKEIETKLTAHGISPEPKKEQW